MLARGRGWDFKTAGEGARFIPLGLKLDKNLLCWVKKMECFFWVRLLTLFLGSLEVINFSFLG